MPDQSAAAQKRYFNVAIIAPLEEEFEILVEHFVIGENMSDDNNIRFVATAPGSHEVFLLIKQADMGRTANADAVARLPSLTWDYLLA